KDYLIRKTTLKDLVNPVIRNHSKIFIQEKIKLTTTHLDLPVLADSKWAYFIIGQILDNALKYVLTDNSERIPTISILGKTDQKRTLLIISDNGIGIAQNDLEGIFSKGFTGSNGRIKSINSTGIGLYLCKKLCDKMGVLITLTSDLGYGTRVTLSFAVPK
ncbi:MAG: ATP-binding protein, partial [Eubacterium sp.]